MAAPNVIRDLQQRARDGLKVGRFDDALAAARNLLAFSPGDPDALAVAGIASLLLGQAEPAIAHLEAAVKRRQDMPVVWLHLGNARKTLGRKDDAIKAYRKALTLKPDLAPASHNLGTLLQEAGQHEEAAAIYRAAIARAPQPAGTWRNLALALEETKHLKEAEEAYRQAIAKDPDWLIPRSAHMRLLWTLREMDALLAACDDWLAQRPGDTEALAWTCLALAEKGEAARLAALLDFDGLVRVFDHDPPPGWASMAEFHAALRAHVYAHPTLKVPPQDHPTYHHPDLAITEELLAGTRGPMEGYEALVRLAVERYRASLPADHPVRVNWPARWRLSVWATLLKGQGNLVPHIHLDGYIGGVYYALLPAVAAREDSDQAAWFELGRPPEELGCTHIPSTRRIQPREGRMILFPSYFYHGTVPFTAGEDRISIAFDVVPEP